jgi:hypothetical protein
MAKRISTIEKGRGMSSDRLASMLVNLAEATPSQTQTRQQWESKLKTYLETLRWWDEQTMAPAITAGLKVWKWFPTIAEIQEQCKLVAKERTWELERQDERMRLADRTDREELTSEQKALNVKPLTDFVAGMREKNRDAGMGRRKKQHEGGSDAFRELMGH